MLATALSLLLIFAQESEKSSDYLGSGLIGGMIGAIGGVGFSIWYGYYTTTVTLPSNLKDFKEERALDRAERALERKAFEDTVEKLAVAIRSGAPRGGGS